MKACVIEAHESVSIDGTERDENQRKNLSEYCRILIRIVHFIWYFQFSL